MDVLDLKAQRKITEYQNVVKHMLVFAAILSLIPIWRGFHGEPERLWFLINVTVFGIAYLTSRSPKYIEVSKKIFAVILFVTFVLVYYTNGLTYMLGSWGIAFSILSLSTIDLRLGSWSFIGVILTFFITSILLEFGYLTELADPARRPGFIIECIHGVIMIAFVVYALNRYAQQIHDNNEQLYKNIELERNLNAQKDQFLSNMSHELRTPLNGIYGVLQIVKGRTEKEQRLLKAAKGATESLTHIVNEILDHAKLASGKLEITPEWICTSTTCHQLTDMFALSAKSKNINFTMNSDLPDELYCDGVRMGQILNNIVGNAIKFTPQYHNVTVNLSYDMGHMLISVIDTGIGMDKNALETLYDRFTQADGTTTRKYGGTGLGMNITKQLVELMDGDISVQSAPKLGTRVDIQIPVEGRSKKKETQEKTPPKLETMPVLGGVLVVDDDPTNRMLCETVLTQHYDVVDIASNGMDALQLARNNTYDCIITDICMPDISGEILLERIRNIKPDQAIIAVTGNVGVEDHDRYKKIGFNAVLTKPYNIDNLVTIVQKHSISNTNLVE